MSEPSKVPLWIKAILGIQLVLAGLFFLLGWSHTVSLAQGRAASWQDLLALALPLALVTVASIGSVWSWRRGQRQVTGLLAIAPWPLALAAFMLMGVL